MMINNKIKLFLPVFMAALLLSFTAQAQQVAANTDVMDIPSVSGSIDESIDTTHPILRLTQDKSQIVRLNQEAASVIVGNPNHVSVLLDTPDTLVVVPRAAGASHFTVVSKDGSILMQRHVIVGAAKEQYVRIRRSCAPGNTGCQPTSVYFCPDMCHEVRENTQR